MTTYPARVRELGRRFDPDRHPPASPLAAGDEEDEPEPPAERAREHPAGRDRTSVHE